MNKAIVIFGQQRFVDIGIYSFRKNIVDFKEYDIFIHTWKDESKDESFIYDLWKPTDILIEEPIPFSGSDYEVTHKSLFYSTKRGFELLNKSDKKYDAVIRTRFDMCVETPIDITDYDLTQPAIFSPDVCGNPAVLSDFLMFGSGNCMNIYQEMFDNYEKYKREGVNVGAGEEIINRAIYDNAYTKVKTNHKVYGIRPVGVSCSLYWANVDNPLVTKYLPS